MSDETGRPRRRVPIRWLSLAEAVAVAAVAISALGLYNSWNNRADTPAPPADARPAPARPLVLRAEARDGGKALAVKAAEDGHVIQSQIIAFPAALGVDPVETTGDPRIESAWIDQALARAAPEDKLLAGDRRVPVLLTTRYIEGGTERTDRAVYQLGYALSEGGLFGGRHVRLRGLSLAGRGAQATQARLDAMWKPADK